MTMKKTFCRHLLLGLALTLCLPSFAGGSDPSIGDVMWVAFTVIPDGWKRCEGQLLATTEHPQFFAQVGNTFGGDGVNNYAIPDARGRALFHAGASAGPGLSLRTLGEQTGSETEAMSIEQMPPHNHLIETVNQRANTNVPVKNSLSQIDNGYSSISGIPDSSLIEGSVSPAGNGTAANNMSPFTTMYCLVWVGRV